MRACLWPAVPGAAAALRPQQCWLSQGRSIVVINSSQSCSPSAAEAWRGWAATCDLGHAAAEANAKTIIADWLMEKALPVLVAVDGGQLAVEYMGFIEQASLWQLQQHQKAGKSLELACKLPCCGSRSCVAATTAP